MTGIGWEFYGIKFSVVMTLLVSFVMYLGIRYGGRSGDYGRHTDSMAGDEGED